MWYLCHQIGNSRQKSAWHVRDAKFFFFFLSLAPQPSLGLGLLQKIRLNFMEASQHFFYSVGLLAPRPTPIPEDQASVFISLRGRMAQLYPWAPILVASYDTHGLRWDYSYSRSPHGEWDAKLLRLMAWALIKQMSCNSNSDTFHTSR
jgi:hypothetical protein